MRVATKEDLAIESQTFADAWNFLKKWYFIDGADEHWEQLVAEARELHTKSNGNKLTKDIVISVIDYIEKAYKEREISLINE